MLRFESERYKGTTAAPLVPEMELSNVNKMASLADGQLFLGLVDFVHQILDTDDALISDEEEEDEEMVEYVVRQHRREGIIYVTIIIQQIEYQNVTLVISHSQFH